MMMNPAVFPVQNYKNAAKLYLNANSCLSQESTRKKTIKCFFFLFLFLTSSQEVLSADRPSTSNMWIVGYFQMCIYFDFLFIAAEVCNQPYTAPWWWWWWCWLSPCVRPPAGCCHLLLVSSVEGEVSSRVVTSSWADCCCGIETTHWSYCNEGSAERSAAPGCSLELPTLPDACVDALQLISLSVSFLSFPLKKKQQTPLTFIWWCGWNQLVVFVWNGADHWTSIVVCVW